MSTCISSKGEFGSHTTTEGNFICDDCGVLDEEGIFTEVATLRARVARLTEQLQHECPHGEMSWTGADQNWDDDKVWRCDNCGATGTDDELRAPK